jgi:hypothetical protein
MKLRVGFLIVISSLLCSLTCFSQETCLPDSVVKKIIDELVVKDHLQFTTNVQDSIVNVLNKSIAVHKEKINTYILKEQEYKSMVSSLEQRINIKDAQITDAKKNRRGKLRAFLGGTLVGGVITVIIVLL